MLQLTIGFIGGGNMAEGIISGMLEKLKIKSTRIRVFDPLTARRDLLTEQYGVQSHEEIAEVACDSDVIILAVRPQDLATACKNLKPYIKEHVPVVSICAGVKIQEISSQLHETNPVARVMPNTLIGTGYGYSATLFSDNFPAKRQQEVEEIFSSIGSILRVEETMFDAFTAYSCAGPSTILWLMNAMIDAGVETGFSRAQSRAIVMENMLGAVERLNQSNRHPFELIETMTSPGGVTIRNLGVLHSEGAYAAIMNSTREAVAKAKEIATTIRI